MQRDTPNRYMGMMLNWLAILSLSILAACASAAEMKNMVVDQRSLVESTPDTPFRNAISIGRVDGGESTNPLWTSEVGNAEFRGAFRSSLERSGLLSASHPKAKFTVSAALENIDQPIFGLDLSVYSRVKYRVMEKENKKIWFDDFVAVSFTATFGDSPFAIQRLRLANEGSIRENIKRFILRLLEIKN